VSQLRTKLADPIAHRAVTEAEPFGYVERCVLVDEDRPQNFVTALSDRTGMQKELLTGVPIHREPPWKVSFLWTPKTPPV
jgi:hypothetical protein